MKKKKSARVWMSLLLLLSLLMSGCQSKQVYSSDYSLGIIYTKEYNNDTKFCLYDHELDWVQKLKYNYPNIAYDGFCNSLIDDGKLYLCPKGHADKLDYGKILAFNLENGNIDSYQIGRTNIVDFAHNDNKLYTASNLDGICYIDQMDCESMKIQTIEVEKFMVSTLVTGSSGLFGIALDMDTEEYVICMLNFSDNSCQELYRMENSKEVDFLQYYKEKLYFAHEMNLFEYNIMTDEIKTYKLPHTNAYNLSIQGSQLFIACTDIFEDKKSYVDVYDLEDGEIKELLEVEGSILQMEISKTANEIYLLDYEKITRYVVKDYKFHAEGEIILQPEGDFYVGGFFLNEANTKSEEKRNEKYKNSNIFSNNDSIGNVCRM